MSCVCTLTPSSGVPKKFLVGLERTWDQMLSCVLALFTCMITHPFQFRFAATEHYWQPCRLFTLILQTGNQIFPLALVPRVLKPCVVWFHIDTIFGIPKESLVGFEEDLRSELVFWFDPGHTRDHSLLPIPFRRCWVLLAHEFADHFFVLQDCLQTRSTGIRSL